jgi:hypothetical protein
MHENSSLKRPDEHQRTLTDGCCRPNVSRKFRPDGVATKRYGTSHKFLLAAWFLFCGLVVAGLMWVLMRDILLAVVLGLATIPFVWMLSSGWQESDLVKRALRLHMEERTRRDA